MKKNFIVFMAVCLSFFVLLCGCTASNQEEEMSVIVITRVSRQTTNTSGTMSTSTSSNGSSSTTAATSSTTTATSSATAATSSKTSKEPSSTTSTTTTTTTTIALPSTDEMIKDMKGLNVLALGDSLFRGTAASGTAPDTTGEKVWINRLAKQCDWNITNLGIGGMTVSLTAANKANNKQSMYDNLFNKTDFVFGTTNSTYYKYGNTNKPASEVDVIFMLGGANDYDPQKNIPMGTVSSKDKGTFMGAWNLITDKLMQDYPNAAIIFLTSWDLDDWTSRADGITCRQYFSGVKKVYEENYAHRKRVTLIDMGNPAVSGAQMNNKTWRSQYAFDRLHLKEEGMNVVRSNMLPHIWKALKETGTL